VRVLVSARQEWQAPGAVSAKGLVFLVLSGIATGFSWLCYFRALQMAPASRVAPIDKFSVVLVGFIRGTSAWRKADLEDRLGSILIAGGVILTAL